MCECHALGDGPNLVVECVNVALPEFEIIGEDKVPAGLEGEGGPFALGINVENLTAENVSHVRGPNLVVIVGEEGFAREADL